MPKKKENDAALKKNIEPKVNVFGLWKSVPENLKTPLIFLVIFLLITLFYYPVTLGNQTIQSTDVLHNKAMREYQNKDKEGFTLWNPHLYCGMPAYATTIAQREFDITAFAQSLSSRIYSFLFQDYNAIYTFSFFIMAITAFIFMRSQGAGRGISFLTAAGMIFSTALVNLFFSGHSTKLVSLSLIPFLLMLLLKFQKEIKILDIFLFVIGLHLFILNAHVQIVYYAVLTVIVYFIFYTIHGLIHKDKNLLKQLGKTAGIICVASIIALLMSYDTYSQLFEYKKYSTRNADEINKNIDAKAEIHDSELYKYDTGWSFSPEEMMTFIIPSFYGYGGFLYKENGEEQEVNTYFGQMELVNMPMYMGIIVLALGLFGLYSRRKEPFIKFCGILIIFFLLVSFGKNFPIVYDLMFRYLPWFNNFRVPSMILHIVQIIFPILAGLGVMKIIEISTTNINSITKAVKYLFFSSVALLVLAMILNDYLGQWFFLRIKSAAVDNSQKSEMLRAFSGYATKVFLSDVYVMLILLIALSILIWLFIIKKINRVIFIGALSLLIIVDLIRVAERGSIYINRQEIEDLFWGQKQVTTIKKQHDKEPYRIVDMRLNDIGSVDYNNNYYTYFLLEDISGYSAAKPKTYNDIIEKIGLKNLVFWKMANVKYCVSDFPIRDGKYEEIYAAEKLYVYKYLDALSRAYFVDSVAVKSSNEFFDALYNGTFDPKKTAFTDAIDFNFNKPGTNAYVKITKYNDEHLELDANATGNNFLVFATTYVPTEWKAFIDNNETKIIKTNHTFMGIVVPNGKHKIRFAYEPESFFIGKYLSLSLNILLIGGLIVVIVKRKNDKSISD